VKNRKGSLASRHHSATSAVAVVEPEGLFNNLLNSAVASLGEGQWISRDVLVLLEVNVDLRAEVGASKKWELLLAREIQRSVTERQRLGGQ